MSHDLYVRILSAMFLFWNGARVLTYIPTIGKLLARGADVRSYSLLSWGSWALSNGTFALMLLEMSRGIPDRMFWMNLANTLMCLVVSLIIVLKRFPQLPAGMNAAYRTIRRNDSKPVAAFGPVAQHARFGRRALLVTLASALTVAVAGGFVYGVWPNHNQLADIDAMPIARPPLGVPGPTSPTQQTSWSARVVRPSVHPARGTAVARAERAPSMSSARFHHRAVPSAHAAAPRLIAGPPDQADHFATQSRRHSPPPMPEYEAPPPLVYEAPALAHQKLPVAYGAAPVVYVYATAPAAYGYAYEGEYWDRRHGHDNGWHKGWRTHHHEDDDE